MRLKKLVLQGFKSFADRTEFVFDTPITGIVGPNGCGKSNVVDGFKWVLGEQSAKSLRGDAMMDVIFNGSGGRKPAGMAEVVLVFDNPKREDGARMLNLDADEVAVGRRLYRDGASEYAINGSASRLKDIRELFLDTGVGVDAYSVIEQGRVSALLEANPAERRMIFEEAAGISKYKVKKKEAQRKLEKVDQNLLRLNDIVEEVEKRLRSVKMQAGRARTYQEHSQRLRELRLMHALREYHSHYEQLEALRGQEADARFRLDDVVADLQRGQNELAGKTRSAETLEQQKQSAEYELVRVTAALQSAKQRQHHATEQLAQMAEQLETFERDRGAMTGRLASAQEALAGEERSLAHLTGELSEHRQEIEKRQGAFHDGQLRLNEINREIERHKSAVLDLMRKLATTNSRLGAIEIERKNIAQQQGRLGERRRVVVEEHTALEAARAGVQQQLDEVLGRITQQQQAMETRRQEAQHLGQRIAQTSEQLASAREHRSGLLSRQKLLSDLESNREGVSEGVKSVLRHREERFPFVRGLVADVMRVDVEHAAAIEAALDGRDQWLVTDDSAAAVAAGDLFEELEGRVNLICADRLGGSGAGGPPVICAVNEADATEGDHGQDARATGSDEDHGQDARAAQGKGDHGRVTHATGYDWNRHGIGLRLAVDLVRVRPEDAPLAGHLLGTTAIVDDLASAHRLHREGPSGWRYVTLGGDVVESDGTLRLGPMTAAMGLLSRHAELEVLTHQIAETGRRVDDLSSQLTSGNEQARQMEADVNALRNAIYELNTQKVKLGGALSANGDKQNALAREQVVLDRELQAFVGQSDRLSGEEAQLAQRRQEFETSQAEHQAQADALVEQQKQTAADLQTCGEELTSCRVQLGQVQEKQLASRQQVQRQQSAIAEIGGQIERLTKSAEALTGRRGTLERELNEAKREEVSLEEQRQTLDEQGRRLAGELGEAKEAARELTHRVEAVREQHAELEQTLHGLQMKLGELNVRLETLVQRALEELELNLPERHAELSAQTNEAGEVVGYQPDDLDWDAVAEEIKALREKIQRLGNVNLDAIGEQDELEQRQTFLATQVADLTTSKSQLEQLIGEINTESSLRFEQCFNAVREHFQGLFRKLFGGGKADIFLETEIEVKARDGEVGEDGQPLKTIRKTVDVLDAGIEIIARPPGKQPVSISQLSGGEKTMTCVALLMSLFKSKPSPFCILDEVDAALDEANNQRFNLIVQEFLEYSQFIVITHSKRTMQIADVLYGVTMQEQGVSKRVAVKFDQVDSQGRISGDAVAAGESAEATADEKEYAAA